MKNENYDVTIKDVTNVTTAKMQHVHVKTELAELNTEMERNKPYAALMEAGDLFLSTAKLMKTLIAENNFDLTIQETIDHIIYGKNSHRRYYDEPAPAGKMVWGSVSGVTDEPDTYVRARAHAADDEADSLGVKLASSTPHDFSDRTWGPVSGVTDE